MGNPHLLGKTMEFKKHVMFAIAAMAAGFTAAFAQTGTISVHDADTQNPAWTLAEMHPAAFVPQVGDMAMLPDGRLVILEFVLAGTDRENTTNVIRKNGKVHLLSNFNAADLESIKIETVDSGLGEPTGVCVVNGKIYVAEKNQLTELTLGAAGAPATRRKVSDLTFDPLGTVNFQEYNFGLVYKDGYFYTATGGGVRIGGKSYSDDLGKLTDATRDGLLKIKASDGTQELINGGLRAPNGVTFGPDSTFWVTDNQGSWLPSCKLINVVAGRNYGYPNGPSKFRGMAETPPTVWFPYAEIGKSTTHPIYVKGGLYKGQFLIGDLSQGGMMRAAVEKVNGEYQGSAHSFGGGFAAGIETMVEQDDGSFILGGLGRGDNGNWGWKARVRGLQKMTPKAGTTLFEMLAVRSKSDGMEIEFSKPVADGSDQAALYTVFNGTMIPGPAYGEGNMQTKTVIPVTGVKVSADKKRVLLQIDAAANAHKVIAIKVTGLKSATAEDLYRPAAWYTLNSVSTAPFNPSAAIHDRAAAGDGLSADRILAKRVGDHLSVAVPFAGAHILTLRSLQGRVLETRSGSGAREYLLGGAGFAPGVYLLDVQAGEKILRKNIVF
jgi:glucose/arabinose dehydrogenase